MFSKGGLTGSPFIWSLPVSSLNEASRFDVQGLAWKRFWPGHGKLISAGTLADKPVTGGDFSGCCLRRAASTKLRTARTPPAERFATLHCLPEMHLSQSPPLRSACALADPAYTSVETVSSCMQPKRTKTNAPTVMPYRSRAESFLWSCTKIRVATSASRQRSTHQGDHPCRTSSTSSIICSRMSPAKT